MEDKVERGQPQAQERGKPECEWPEHVQVESGHHSRFVGSR